MNQKDYQQKYHRLCGVRDEKKQRLERLLEDISSSLKRAERLEEARSIIQSISTSTQKTCQDFIESVVTLALKSVYPDRDFSFAMVFEERKDRMEITPYVRENGYLMDIKDEMAGGVTDIVSFALRITLWSMSAERTSPVFILDEPFKFTGALIDRAGEMLKEISSKLNLQIIMVSHDDELINCADKSYRVRFDQRMKKSVVEEV